MSRPHDIIVFYQQAWSTQYGIRQILSKRQHVWHQLRQYLEYIPQRYLIQICGDFNIPFGHMPHLIHIHDPKYHQATQKDKQVLAQLVQYFEFIPLHYGDKCQITFS